MGNKCPIDFIKSYFLLIYFKKQEKIITRFYTVHLKQPWYIFYFIPITLKTTVMKTMNPLIFLSLLCISLLLSSCTAIGDIFKTGVGVGIFIVVFVILLIGGIIVAMNRK